MSVRGFVSKRTSKFRHEECRPCQRAIALLTAVSMFLVSCDQNGNVADSEPAPQSIEREAKPTQAGETATAQPPESESEARPASDATVNLEAPQSVAAGSAMQFAWQGPNAPGDLIFIANPDMAANRYPMSADHHHRTQEGSPAQLVAPAEPGRYEIRYFSRANGAVLLRSSLTVTNPEARLDAPATVVAGSALQFAWQGPNAPGDLIFIANLDMAANRYLMSADHHHQTKEGLPAQLVAPAEPGRYEIRYFSRANGAVLVRSPLTVR
jgi:Ca-activated chloride channel family protein